MSQLRGIFLTREMDWPEPQRLEDDDNDEDDDNNEEFSCACHSAHPPPQCKSHDSSSDSQVEDLGEPIPFSLSPRHSYTVEDKAVKNRTYAERLALHALELEEEIRKFQEVVYGDTKVPGSLFENGDHSWTRTYHLPVHQRSYGSQTASVAQCGCYNSSQCSVGKDLRMDGFDPWDYVTDPYLGPPKPTRGAKPYTPHREAIKDKEFWPLKLTHDKLREENAMLRRVVSSMQSSLKRRAFVVQRLEMQLKDSLAKKERQVQEMESFILLVDETLQLMTQQALEAESNMKKLKQEVFAVQEELERTKLENESLRAGQTTDLGAVRCDINFVLKNLNKIIMGTNWSIVQLTSGAELLRFVAEILKSTGKISEVEAQKVL
ncbi:PREDICTED: serologically defined colon cancer antigen 3 homolog [Mesitornis unicolor]|uniref:serologically defined colon cancer antigen 3 homolog n=1 Tax=Mesitornis unicolor TaxID=54374 RepID=UPI000528A426|nr:PREDICTED: serologically defined colon cancer antigen 3 homolog [Mesitornis unicolor]